MPVLSRHTYMGLAVEHLQAAGQAATDTFLPLRLNKRLHADAWPPSRSVRSSAVRGTNLEEPPGGSSCPLTRTAPLDVLLREAVHGDRSAARVPQARSSNQAVKAVASLDRLGSQIGMVRRTL